MDDVTLRSIQLVELDMLKEFVKVCETLNLQYFVIGGTCLGAVRHKGFIPWDDDIDVALPRNDYEIFIEKAQDLLDKKYFVQTYKTDVNYVLNYAKMRNSETTFIETSHKLINMNHGVYIDIFPLDGCSNIDLFPKINIFRKRIMNFQIKKYLYFKDGDNDSLKVKITTFISNLLYGRKSLRQLQEKKEKIYTKYRYKNYKKVVNYEGVMGNKEIISKSYFKQGIKKPFEDIEVVIPCDYDNYLKDIYGNYMELPPENKRMGHHYYEILDLEKPYTEYMKEFNLNGNAK